VLCHYAIRIVIRASDPKKADNFWVSGPISQRKRDEARVDWCGKLQRKERDVAYGFGRPELPIGGWHHLCSMPTGMSMGTRATFLASISFAQP
jgi:hypothetical protein